MDKVTKKQKLMKQIMKFGIVGGLAFLIDFIVYTIVLRAITWEYNYLLAGFAGFMISLIFNYLASMAFVFERKENADRKKEFSIFLVLSLIGMGINTLILWLCMDVIYYHVGWVQNLTMVILEFLHNIGIGIANATELAALASKVCATGVVMVYNFISRKMFLEKKEDGENEK